VLIAEEDPKNKSFLPFQEYCCQNPDILALLPWCILMTISHEYAACKNQMRDAKNSTSQTIPLGYQSANKD